MPARIRMWFVCLPVVLAGGCIPSLYPIYTSDTLADCSALIGQWSSQDGNQSWTFSGDSDRQCQLLYIDNQKQRGRFSVRLTEIGEDLFMDLAPEPAFAGDTAGFYKLHWQQTHTFYRIHLDKKSLSLSFINPEWLKKHLRANPQALKWEEVDSGSAFLTSSTPELRAFVQAHSNTPGAFSQPVRLTRISSN